MVTFIPIGQLLSDNETNQARLDAQQAAADALASKTAAATSESNAFASASAAAASAAAIIPDAAIAGLHYSGVAWYQAGAVAPDTYQALAATGADAGLLAGNTSYTRQTAGVPANLAVQSRMRRVLLANNGSTVVGVLDCDDSTKLAGVNGLRGWVRVHEGFSDPVRPIPGQTGSGNARLRLGVLPWSADTTYPAGARVTYGGSLWESIDDANLGITPAAGTTAADLSGATGQVMVYVPRFYYRQDFDAGLNRHSYEIVFDEKDYLLLATLLEDGTNLVATKTVNGRVFQVHPAFAKAGVQRRARFIAAFGTSCTDTGNNATGVMQSIFDGATTNTTNVSLQNYTSKARNRNSGLTDPSGNANNVWQVADNWLWSALQLLFLTEYRTFYAQSVLGGGNQSGSGYNKIAGRSAPVGNASGSFNASGVLQTPNAGSDFDGMTYRGIEDIYGTAWHRTAGGVVKNTPTRKEIYLCNTPAQFVDTSETSPGYALVATSPYVPPSDNWYNPAALAAGSFLAAANGGSGSTYTTDGNYLRAATDNSINILMWGAFANGGAYTGLFALDASAAASYADVDRGAALAR